MASYSVPSYDSFTRSMAFDTPYKPLNISPSADVVDAYSNAITRRYEAPLDIPESRSTWGRIGDALSVGVYPLAGFMKGMLDDNQPNQITPWQGLVNGFKASNPFGEGFAKGETTWSDVLETAGWHPDSVLGKIAKGTQIGRAHV